MITKYAHELEFISQIARDGSKTFPVEESYLNAMIENPLMKKDHFYLHRLSLSQNTYIAFNFNAFVVRVKSELVKPTKSCCCENQKLGQTICDNTCVDTGEYD